MNNFNDFKKQVEDAKASIFGEMDSLIQQMEESGDLEKYYEKGVRSAAGRLRKSLQLIRKSIHNPTVRNTMNSISDGAKSLREKLNS